MSTPEFTASEIYSTHQPLSLGQFHSLGHRKFNRETKHKQLMVLEIDKPIIGPISTKNKPAKISFPEYSAKLFPNLKASPIRTSKPKLQHYARRIAGESVIGEKADDFLFIENNLPIRINPVAPPSSILKRDLKPAVNIINNESNRPSSSLLIGEQVSVRARKTPPPSASKRTAHTIDAKYDQNLFISDLNVRLNQYGAFIPSDDDSADTEESEAESEDDVAIYSMPFRNSNYSAGRKPRTKEACTMLKDFNISAWEDESENDLIKETGASYQYINPYTPPPTASGSGNKCSKPGEDPFPPPPPGIQQQFSSLSINTNVGGSSLSLSNQTGNLGSIGNTNPTETSQPGAEEFPTRRKIPNHITPNKQFSHFVLRKRLEKLERQQKETIRHLSPQTVVIDFQEPLKTSRWRLCSSVSSDSSSGDKNFTPDSGIEEAVNPGNEHSNTPKLPISSSTSLITSNNNNNNNTGGKPAKSIISKGAKFGDILQRPRTTNVKNLDLFVEGAQKHGISKTLYNKSKSQDKRPHTTSSCYGGLEYYLPPKIRE